MFMEEGMTDLEMTMLCALAMGFDMSIERGDLVWDSDMPQWYANKVSREPHDVEHWEPLKDDAQAMALVKKMELMISPPIEPREMQWLVTGMSLPSSRNLDLNRAIVECVAKMQSA